MSNLIAAILIIAGPAIVVAILAFAKPLSLKHTTIVCGVAIAAAWAVVATTFYQLFTGGY